MAEPKDAEAERLNRLIAAQEMTAIAVNRLVKVISRMIANGTWEGLFDAEPERRHFSAAVRLRVFLAHDGACVYCGAALGERFCLDHVEPLARGGADDEENLALSCDKCNNDKGAKAVREWRTGARIVRTGNRWRLISARPCHG